MSKKAAIAAAVLAVVSTSAFAQGITGGSVGLEYNAPTDGSDFGGTTYTGGLEYAINRQFGVSVNATGYNPTNLDISGSNLTLHGIYHLNDQATLGLFVARDSREEDDNTVNIYGFEGGTEIQGGEISAYIGQADNGDETTLMLGAEGAYALRNGFAIIGEIDMLNDGPVEGSRVAIGGQYEIQGGPQLYAKVGTATFEDEDQTFIGIGARVAFGAARGTTFEGRSGFDALAGF